MKCCNFCGKKEVESLIAGHNVYICNECVELCVQIIADGDDEPEEDRRDNC